MKKHKIIFWTIASLIFIFEGVLTALTFNTEMARTGVSHLGYPYYFGNMLAAFKVVGALALILPSVRGWKKEWAFAGFFIVFISAAVSNWAVDGFGGLVIFPLVFVALLFIAHNSYHKINN